MKVLLGLVLCVVRISHGDYVRHDGYQVLHLDVDDRRIDDVLHILKNDEELDFWHFPVDLMVPPSKLTEVKNLLDTKRVYYTIKIPNVQSLIDNQLSRDAPRVNALGDYDFTRYYNLKEINTWIDDVVVAYPSMASDFVVGYSYEGTPMRALKLASTDGLASKLGIWYHGGIHSREWISPATVMFITTQFLEDYEVDPDVKKMFDQFEFYVLPVLNVDGYNYTWVENRMWRKTRSPNEGSTCIGTDPNRNYDFMWGFASDNPCASDYRGASAASEVEIKAVQDYLMQATTEQTFAMSIDFHSYSQWWVTPWAYTNETAPHYVDLDASAAAAVTALESVHGTQYQSGALINGGSGLAMDWYYAEALIKYSYLVELRDTGEYGFLLPEDQIIPSGEETYAGMKAAITYILNHEF